MFWMMNIYFIVIYEIELQNDKTLIITIQKTLKYNMADCIMLRIEAK